jgi:hypothetical protein
VFNRPVGSEARVPVIDWSAKPMKGIGAGEGYDSDAKKKGCSVKAWLSEFLGFTSGKGAGDLAERTAAAEDLGSAWMRNCSSNRVRCDAHGGGWQPALRRATTYCRLACISVVAFLPLLSACTELYQSLSVGPWTPIGIATMPVERSSDPSRTRFELKLRAEGSGSEIKPGMLVHATVTGHFAPSSAMSPNAPVGKIDDAWFWVGDARHVGEKQLSLLRFGSDALRAAFVGARSGARLYLVLDPKQPARTLALPKRGFLLDYIRAFEFTGGSDNDSVYFENTVEYEITVVAVCPGDVLQREGTLKQLGYVPNFSTRRNLPFAREGRLHWAAIEAQCDQGGKVRMEKGPAYPFTGTLTTGWPESYDKASGRRIFGSR